MRLIDADALQDKLQMFSCYCEEDECDFMYIDLRTVINAPTIDAVPVVHAKWEHCFEDWRHQFEGDKCYACGFEHYGIPIDHYPYCPSCGARMDGGADDGKT